MNIRFLSCLLLTSYAVANDILDIAINPENNGLFETLVVALDTAGIASTFDNPHFCEYSWAQSWSWCKEYTVFAPTNDAFDKLPQGAIDRLFNEEFLPHLIDLLLYHVIDGEIFSSDITDGAVVETMNGETILANVNNATITINGSSKVIVPDVDASNGVVHVVDNVLLPRSAAKNIVEAAATEADFSTFVSLLRTEEYDLGELVSSPENILTVFAPTNGALQELIDGGFDTSNPTAVADLLKYHIIQGTILTSDELHQGDIPTVQGSSISVDIVGNFWSGYEVELNGGVRITKENILASNGIIHAIDTVLRPAGDVVSIASSNSEFSDLVAAIAKAELVNILQGDGPFTVFAPTNEAFLKAGIDVSTATKEELTPILLYHVLGGSKVLSGDLTSTVIQTNPVNPTNLIVDISEGWFRKDIILNDDVNVINVDIEASNGVIHVIDDVLIPPDDIVDTAAKNNAFSTLVALLSAQGIDLATTLTGDGPFTLFAPTNAAFDRLGDVDLSTDQLKNVLLYHVSPGNYRLLDIVSKNEFDTAFESEGIMQTIEVIITKFWWWIVSVGVKGDLNNVESNIIAGDILAANGLIHAIDEVLLPNLQSSSSPPPTPSPSQTCKTVQTLDVFDIDQYVSKKWYSHQQRPVIFNSEARFYCITAEYSFLDPSDNATVNEYDVKVFNKGQDVDGNIFTSDDQFAEGDIRVPSGLCAGQKVFAGDKDSELTVGFCIVPVTSYSQSNYWVLAYDEEEGVALIAGGQPDTLTSNADGLCTYSNPISGLWIFTRSPVRNETLIEKYRDIARDNGIDPSIMKDVAQEDCAYSPSAEPSPMPSLRGTLSPLTLPSLSPTIPVPTSPMPTSYSPTSFSPTTPTPTTPVPTTPVPTTLSPTTSVPTSPTPTTLVPTTPTPTSILTTPQPSTTNSPTKSLSSSPSQSPTSPSSSKPTRPSFFSFTDSPTSFSEVSTSNVFGTNEPTPNLSDTNEPTPNLSDTNEPSPSASSFGF